MEARSRGRNIATEDIDTMDTKACKPAWGKKETVNNEVRIVAGAVLENTNRADEGNGKHNPFTSKAVKYHSLDSIFDDDGSKEVQMEV